MERMVAIHDKLLQATANEHERFGTKELTTFFPVRGRLSAGELMVVGRAVNGWSDRKWTAADAADSKRRAEIISEVVDKSIGTDRCPMAWVKDNWSHNRKGEWEARRSAFFQLSRAISHQLLGEMDDWPSKLIFSNLYKIAPYQGMNPSSRLCAVQQTACEDHLAAELEVWKPKRVLVIAGWNWAQPFVERLGGSSGTRKGELVEWSGTIKLPNDDHEVRLVVCLRPERRQQEPLVKAIVGAFAALASGAV